LAAFGLYISIPVILTTGQELSNPIHSSLLLRKSPINELPALAKRAVGLG